MKIGEKIAMAAFGLLLAGPTAFADTKDSKEKTAEVKCAGINACKGQSACASAKNACKGQNRCKGHGWLAVASEKACKDKHGEVVIDAKQEKTPEKKK